MNLGIAIISALTIASAMAQEIPNGYIQIAYRDRKDGVTSGGFHEIELNCRDNACEATTVTVTECFSQGSEKFAVLQLSKTSTTTGDLAVTLLKPGQLQVREAADNAEFTYTLTFKSKREDDLRKLFRTRSNLFFLDALAFSGVGVQHDKRENKMISWELVPLRWGNARVKIECPL